MRIAVTGASGLLGSALVPRLRAEGHQIVRLVRREARATDEVTWDPAAGTVDRDRLAGVEAAVNLSGAGVGDRRWTASYKRTIRASRVQSTHTLGTALAALDPRPRVLLNASAIGWYGDTGDRAVDESAPAGSTFLAGVVRDWEAATTAAEDAGIRVVHLRTGLVMSPAGGAFGRLWLLYRLGLGGRIGSGRQYWSWITLDDEIRAITHLLTADRLAGPVNLTGPSPVTNAELNAALGRAVHRPAIFVVPARALRLGLGEFSSELLVSQRVLPRRLLDDGFSFTANDIDAAARATAPIPRHPR